jgi:hypothetical protein
MEKKMTEQELLLDKYRDEIIRGEQFGTIIHRKPTKEADYHDEILKLMNLGVAVSASPRPRCPKCGTARIARYMLTFGRLSCPECKAEFRVQCPDDFAQFFAPAPAQEGPNFSAEFVAEQEELREMDPELYEQASNNAVRLHTHPFQPISGGASTGEQQPNVSRDRDDIPRLTECPTCHKPYTYIAGIFRPVRSCTCDPSRPSGPSAPKVSVTDEIAMPQASGVIWQKGATDTASVPQESKCAKCGWPIKVGDTDVLVRDGAAFRSYHINCYIALAPIPDDIEGVARAISNECLTEKDDRLEWNGFRCEQILKEFAANQSAAAPSVAGTQPTSIYPQEIWAVAQSGFVQTWGLTESVAKAQVEHNSTEESQEWEAIKYVIAGGR